MVARKRVIEQANLARDFLEKFDVYLVRGYGRERVGQNTPRLNFRHDGNATECLIRSMSANPKSNIKGDTLDLVIIEDCFPYEAEILTDVGWVKIGDVVEKGRATEVLSYNENTQTTEWNSITNRMTKHTKSLMKVEYDGGHVICTPTHKFLTNKGWKEAQDLNNTKVQLLNYDTRTSRTSDIRHSIRRHFNRISKPTITKREDICQSWISSTKIRRVENIDNQERLQNIHFQMQKPWIWRYIDKICNRMSSLFH